MSSFFHTLNYSSCNEDGLTELRALELVPSDTVCCITGSGDRPLHMLLGNPARVYAVDMNPAQNYLLELKLAAIRHMDYHGFAEFIGLFPASALKRWDRYLDLRIQLTPDAACWFDAHRRMVEQGVLYAGRWERYFQMASHHLRLLRGGKIRTLLAFQDIDQQRDYLHTTWNARDWEWILRLSFNRLAFRYLLGDPGFYSFASASVPPWKTIYDRMTCFLENHLARSSFMMALVFEGRFFDPIHYPPYLKEENFALLRERQGRITIRTCSLFDLLEDPIHRLFTKYSLSDVSSFLDNGAYERLFTFFATQKKNRFSRRVSQTRRTPPVQLSGEPIQYLSALEESLARDDLSFGYSFIIGVTT